MIRTDKNCRELFFNRKRFKKVTKGYCKNEGLISVSNHMEVYRNRIKVCKMYLNPNLCSCNTLFWLKKVVKKGYCENEYFNLA